MVGLLRPLSSAYELSSQITELIVIKEHKVVGNKTAEHNPPILYFKPITAKTLNIGIEANTIATD